MVKRNTIKKITIQPGLYLLNLGHIENIKEENIEKLAGKKDYNVLYSKLKNHRFDNKLIGKFGRSKKIHMRLNQHDYLIRTLEIPDHNLSTFEIEEMYLVKGEREVKKFCYDSKYIKNLKEEIVIVNNKSDFRKIKREMRKIEKKYKILWKLKRLQKK